MTRSPEQSLLTPSQGNINTPQEVASPLSLPIQWGFSSSIPIPYHHLGPSPQKNMQSSSPSRQLLAEAAAVPAQDQGINSTSKAPTPINPAASETPAFDQAATWPEGYYSTGSPVAKRRRLEISNQTEVQPAHPQPAPQSGWFGEGEILVHSPKVLTHHTTPSLAGAAALPLTSPRQQLFTSLQHPSPQNLASYGNTSGASPISSPIQQAAYSPSSSANAFLPSQLIYGTPRPISPGYTGPLESRADDQDAFISGTDISIDSITTFLRLFARLNDWPRPNPKFSFNSQVHQHTMMSITQITMDWQSAGMAFTESTAIRISKDKGAKVGLALFCRAQEVNMLYLMTELREYFNDMVVRLTAEITELKAKPVEMETFMKNNFASRIGTNWMDRAFFGAVMERITSLTRRVVVEKEVVDDKVERVEINWQESVQASGEMAAEQTAVPDVQTQNSQVESEVTREPGKEPEEMPSISPGKLPQRMEYILARDFGLMESEPMGDIPDWDLGFMESEQMDDIPDWDLG